jgi:hypothetical protein
MEAGAVAVALCAMFRSPTSVGYDERVHFPARVRVEHKYGCDATGDDGIDVQVGVIAVAPGTSIVHFQMYSECGWPSEEERRLRQRVLTLKN